MGQKVHPYGFRLGFNRTWKSRWFGGKNYKEWLHEDLRLRKMIKDRFFHAGISKVEITRAGNKMTLHIATSRPGIVIGKKGAEVEGLRLELQKLTQREVFIEIEEIHRPELDAQLLAENVANQLLKRISFRRAMKKSLEQAMRFGALGARIRVGGRLNGAEIARTEWYLEGQLPLHTLRADIDYGFAEAQTTFGVLGIKVWINRGQKLTYDIH